MHHLTRLRWRNRLISRMPWLTGLGEMRHLWQAARVWRAEGWTAPPPYFVRRAMLLSEACAIGAEIFVETGTFKGDTAWSFRRRFRRLVTVEVEPGLAAVARDRFAAWPAVTVVEGDSAAIMPSLCDELDGPALFFLDGHYSGGFTGRGEGDCPVMAELKAILERVKYPFRIVIDDARLFGIDPAYPSVGEVEACLAHHRPEMAARFECDAILIG